MAPNLCKELDATGRVAEEPPDLPLIVSVISCT
jgi:hypothetical protein